jgi:cell division septal protein FtsQ
LNNNIELLLGQGDPKIGMKRFLKVYNYIIPASFLDPANQQEGNTIYVDLRYTHGVAIKQVQEEKYAKR